MNNGKNVSLIEAAKELRVRMGLTQTQMAQQVGKNLSTITRYESAVPPKNQVVARYAVIALEQGYLDLATFFRQALIDQIGADVAEVLNLQWMPQERTVPEELNHGGNNVSPPEGLQKSPQTTDSQNVFNILEDILRLVSEAKKAINQQTEEAKRVADTLRSVELEVQKIKASLGRKKGGKKGEDTIEP